ncbi:unnamed protein product, partial [Pleuronectes platessa]
MVFFPRTGLEELSVRGRHISERINKNLLTPSDNTSQTGTGNKEVVSPVAASDNFKSLRPRFSVSRSGPEDGQPSALTQSAEERVEAGGVARPESTEEPVEAGGAARPENAEERVEAGGAARSENAEERVEAGGAARPESPEERAAGAVLSAKHDPIYGTLAPDLFKRRKFFVLRPGTLNQGIKDVEALVDKEVDGSIHGIWLMAEVDHWNNEKERIVMITDNSLLIFKYDFVMFNCDQVQRIPLNFVDRLTHGPFSFPKRSILREDSDRKRRASIRRLRGGEGDTGRGAAQGRRDQPGTRGAAEVKRGWQRDECAERFSG